MITNTTTITFTSIGINNFYSSTSTMFPQLDFTTMFIIVIGIGGFTLLFRSVIHKIALIPPIIALNLFGIISPIFTFGLIGIIIMSIVFYGLQDEYEIPYDYTPNTALKSAIQYETVKQEAKIISLRDSDHLIKLKCSSCGAPLQSIIGGTVKCEYCNTKYIVNL